MNNNGFETLDLITILSLGLAIDNSLQHTNDELFAQNKQILKKLEKLERLENNVRLNES